MKRAFTLNQMVFIVIVAFIGWKVFYPKFIAKTQNVTTSFAASKELEVSINDIRKYYARYGEFSTIEIMTYVKNFEDITQKLEFNKLIKYGIRQSEKTYYCTIFEVEDKGGDMVITLKPTDDSSKICKDFRENSRYQSLQRVNLNF